MREVPSNFWYETMEDVELLESMSELIVIAGTGLAETIAVLTTADIDDATATTLLDTCLGHVETVAMVAGMGQLDGLQQICAAVTTQLSSLNGQALTYFRERGQSLAGWGEAVVAYLHQPDAVKPAAGLLEPLSDEQRRVLLTRLWPEAVTPQMTTEAVAAPTRAVTGDGPSEAVEEASVAAADAEPASLQAAAADVPFEPLVLDAEAGSDKAESVSIEAAAAIPSAPLVVVDEEEGFESESMPIEAAVADISPENLYENSPLPEGEGSGVRAFVQVNSLTLTLSQREREPVDEPAALTTPVAVDSQPVAVPLDAEDDAAAVEETDATVAEIQPAVATQTVAAVGDSEIARQLAEPLVELAAGLEILTNAEQDAGGLAEAIDHYTSIVDRLTAASEAIGLPGLNAIGVFVKQNVEALAALSPAARVAARAVLEQWPVQVLAYLDDPADEAHALAVVEHLSQALWPQPLAEEQAPELLALLIPNPDEYLAEIEERPSVARPEDVVLTLADDVNPKLVEVFLQESPVNAASFSACVEHIARGDAAPQNLALAQRLAHNLKGSANLVGVRGIANLTHHLEDILEYLAIQRVTPPPALAHLLQEGADCVEAMLDALMGLTEPPQEALRILQDVYDWARRMDAGQLTASAPVTAPVSLEPAEQPAPEWITAPTLTTAHPEAAAVEEVAAPTAPAVVQEAPAASLDKVLRVHTGAVDDMFRLVGEMSIAIDQLQERFRVAQRQSQELRHHDRIIQQRRFEMEHFIDVRHVVTMQSQLRRVGGGREELDPLELNEYDELYSATRGFIETVTDSRRMMLQLRSELAGVERMFVRLQRMKRELQHTVMQARMEPVNTLSARLQRSVRQACRATGKQAELLLEGAEMLLDSEVLGKVVDPLMHLLRNAVDHGIEAPKRRAELGKPPTGVIRLRFAQEGQTVVVSCADDGGGLDYDRIREIAASKGLLAGSAGVDKPTLARLVLTSGFTTRAKVTQLSGRGVGLDVVYTLIKDLKGAMEIGDNPSGGCRITLRLPLTLMTTYCLVVEIAGAQYAIPASVVLRTLSSKAGRFSRLGLETAFELDRDIYAARSLAACLRLISSDDAEFDTQKAVLLAYSDVGPVAVTVDRIVDSYHLVVKSLGRHIKTVRGVAGVSSLADGRLIPVLDLAELLRASAPGTTGVAKPQQTAAPAEKTLAAPQVLIVDDSLSVRQALAQLMEEAGYEPLLARDGVEAVDVLRKRLPDVVLTDIEMPRMNGLELASYIRASHSKTLPIVAITSRTMPKHRQLAQQAGVNLYLTKPFAEDDLLSGVRALLH